MGAFEIIPFKSIYCVALTGSFMTFRYILFPKYRDFFLECIDRATHRYQ